MNLLKAFRTKELGLPQALQWQYIKGVWMPYDAKDGIYIDKAYKTIPVVQSVVSKIVEKSADATPMLYRVKDKRFAEKYFAKKKYVKSRENATELAKLRVKASWCWCESESACGVVECAESYCEACDVRRAE